MSKKHRRLESFREVTRRKPDKPPPPEQWTWRDRIGIWAAILLVLTMTMIAFFVPYAQLKRAVDERLEDWRSQYHMSQQQFDRVRKIEREFHSYRKAIANDPSPTPEEVAKHHQEIAAQLSPEDGQAFLETHGPSTNH